MGVTCASTVSIWILFSSKKCIVLFPSVLCYLCCCLFRLSVAGFCQVSWQTAARVGNAKSSLRRSGRLQTRKRSSAQGEPTAMRTKEDTVCSCAGRAQQLCMQEERYRSGCRRIRPGATRGHQLRIRRDLNMNPFGIEIIDDLKCCPTLVLVRDRATRRGTDLACWSGFLTTLLTLLHIRFAASLCAFRLPFRHGERGTRRRSEHARPSSSWVQPACCRRYAHPTAPARRRQHQRPRHPPGYSHSRRSRRGWR